MSARATRRFFSATACSWGCPCLAVSHDQVEQLLAEVEANPQLSLEIDVAGLTVRAGAVVMAATMPPSAHEALVTGLWDGTGMLLAEFDQVRSLADTLPYVTGRW